MPRDSPGAGGVSGIPARGAHARARRAGVRFFWRYLGERGGRHYYISSDRAAALIAPQRFEDSWEYDGNSELYIRISNEVCELARAQLSAYIFLPRDAPPLLHVHTDGELWLALDDWPKPRDILRVGRLPYAGPESVCRIDYVLDATRRERTDSAYVRVVRKRTAMFHFQVRSLTVIVAESLR